MIKDFIFEMNQEQFRAWFFAMNSLDMARKESPCLAMTMDVLKLTESFDSLLVNTNTIVERLALNMT